jgi:hypothetical protein
MVLWNSGVYGIFESLDLWILSVLLENKYSHLCVFASRLVLRIFIESYVTLVAVGKLLPHTNTSRGGSLSGRWSLVASAEILGCPELTVPLGWQYVWYFGTRGKWDLWIFGSLDFIGTPGKQKSRFVRFSKLFGPSDIFSIVWHVGSCFSADVMPLQAGRIVRRLLGEAGKRAAVGDGQTRKCRLESER